MRESLTYLRILLIVLVATFIVACNQSDDVFENIGHTNVSLKLQIGKQANAGTRTEAGKDELNENVIKNIDLFFYKGNASDDAQPVYVVTGWQMPDGTNVSADLDLDIPISKYKELFPTDIDTQCRIYAIVNRPEASDTDNALPDDKSIASLKDNTILYAPGFADRIEDNITHAYSPSVQSSFVMDGEAVVSRDGANLSGVIPVKRVASKISLKIIGIADKVTDDNGVVWLSDKESVRLSLRRASKRTKLGSTPTEYIYTADKTNDIFQINAVSLDVYDSESESFTTSVPFYTYPTNWKNDENSRTHFILLVEWTKKTDPSVKLKTYYEVNINASGSYTQRNCYYKINQEIRVLGSKEEEKPVEIYPCGYVVLDWGEAMDDAEDITDSEGSLNRMKYLVVDETVAEMHNVFSTQIEFFSSDPIDLDNTTIKWENIAEQTSQTITFATKANATREIDASTGDIIYTFKNEEDVEGVTNRIQGDYKVIIRIHNGNPEVATDISYIYLEHRLNNGMDANSDYTEYTYTIDVVHQDNNKYSETIKIVQYPMITVVAEPNSRPNDNGGVFVNNSTDNYGGVHGLNGSNKNPNRYIISVTSLNEGSKYIIGDPRKKEVDNPSNYFSNSPTMKYPGDTNNRRLKFYHPTVETVLTTNMISPRFMIASSYGVTNSISKDYARRRCATYQEDGYPAGRWRLPTQAEIEYIVSLSAIKIIPVLFGTEGTDDVAKYWSANGAVEVKAKSGTVTPTADTGNGPVRCVYDTWYWTDKCPKTTFTWGDKATF